STMSPSSRSASRWASVAPTFPAPTTVTLRFISLPLRRIFCSGDLSGILLRDGRDGHAIHPHPLLRRVLQRVPGRRPELDAQRAAVGRRRDAERVGPDLAGEG